MKKLYFLSACLLSASISHAQFSLNANNAPKIGDNHALQQADTTGVTPGSSGNDVTWDYSNLVLLGDSSSYEVIAPSSTPYAADFPNANLAHLDQAGQYIYYQTSATEYSFHGSVSDDGMGGQLVYAYTDPATYFTFPMAFGATVNDDLAAGYSTQGMVFTRTGSITSEYDAFGTLITPEGTFNNVARIRIHEDDNDQASVQGFPVTVKTVVITYLWLQEDSPAPIMQISYVTVNSSGIVTHAKNVGFRSGTGTVSVNETENTQASSIYPNPTQDKLQVDLPLDSKNIHLHDFTGRRIQSLENMQENDISSLPAGAYILRYELKGSIITKQIIKQ